MSPVFLSEDQVLEVHREQIALFGGADGLRDKGLLEAALAMPQAGFGGQYAHADVPAMAAAYLFHLARNHPFIDGNKRVAASTAVIFLVLNGYEPRLTNEELASLTLGVAEGRITKDGAARSLRLNSVKKRPRKK